MGSFVISNPHDGGFHDLELLLQSEPVDTLRRDEKAVDCWVFMLLCLKLQVKAQFAVIFPK